MAIERGFSIRCMARMRGSVEGSTGVPFGDNVTLTPIILTRRRLMQSRSMHVLRTGVALAALVTWPATWTYAQSGAYPTKPIRVIVANSPGGGLDVVARLISPTLTAALGQQMIIDNRAGATGSVAAELTAKAPPDGYTIMVGAIGNLAVNPHIYKGLGYDPTKDFSPVTFAVSGSNVLVVHSSLPVKTFQEFIALARAQPGKLTYGSSGSGNAGHLAAELLSSMA